MASQQKITVEAGDDDDAAALFHSYDSSLYYVQSPSAASHTAQSAGEAASSGRLPSPDSGGAFLHLVLSCHSSSSSRDFNNSFLNESRLKQGMGLMKEGSSINGGVLRNGEGKEEGEVGKGVTSKLGVLDSRKSLCSVAFQLAWRLAASLGIALLVFFLATKPPPPDFSFKILKVRHFSLGEGLDESGVSTKILSFNCSVEMEVDNKSIFFGLHIHPPLLQISFGRLTFATSQSQESYVESASSSSRELFVGVKNKPMYGAGRSMQDLLESGQDLSLIVQIRAGFSYRVVWDFIKLRSHHTEDCNIILQGLKGPRLYANMHSSTCLQS